MRRLQNIFFGNSSASGTSLTPVQKAERARVVPFSITNPSNQVLDLADILPGYVGDNGWLLVRFLSSSIGSNQYPIMLSSGSTSTAIGMRINPGDSTPNTIQNFYRNNGGSASGAVEKAESLQPNVIYTAIYCWNSAGEHFFICEDTYKEATFDTALLFEAGDLDELSIGGRNAGLDPLSGKVLYAEVGDTALTKDMATARLALANNGITIATAGQSNIENINTNVQDGDKSARLALATAIADTTTSICPGQVVQVHAAEGGSSILSDRNPTEYWLEDDLSTPGPELVQFYDKVSLTGTAPDFILWDQGESESFYIDATSNAISRADYKIRLKALFDHFKSTYPDVHILIGHLGIRTSTFTTSGDGIQKVAEIQDELIAENSWISFGWERYDKPLFDGVHFTKDAGLDIAGRIGRRIGGILGLASTVGTEGPRLFKATKTGAVVTATLTHDVGTDFTPSTGIDGFTYIQDDGTEIAVSSAVRASGSTVAITLASAPTAGKLYYVFDTKALNLANVLKDNTTNTLPLQRGSVVVS